MTCSKGVTPAARGHEIAARYVASQLESFGLKPGGENGTWYQRITFQQTDRGAERGSVTISGPKGETRFPHAGDVVVWLNHPRKRNRSFLLRSSSQATASKTSAWVSTTIAGST